MAIRFFLEDVLTKKMKLNIRYNRRPKKLPVVLSKEEVKKLFEVIQNPTHKLMIELMYSSGLRVSELINLKLEDLELERGFGWVHGGKGNKDRLFIIAESLRNKIRKHTGKKKLNEYKYLFMSNRGTRYNIRSLQQIIKKAGKKAKIDKKISCHTLRHSFATHLIENGYDVSNVQCLLGHKSPETTMVYVHMAYPNMINIKSPIDSL